MEKEKAHEASYEALSSETVWSSYLNHYMKGVLRGRNSLQSQRQEEEAEIQRRRSDGD